MTGQHEVRWCFHTTAMVADYERTRDALNRLCGLRILEDSRIAVRQTWREHRRLPARIVWAFS